MKYKVIEVRKVQNKFIGSWNSREFNTIEEAEELLREWSEKCPTQIFRIIARQEESYRATNRIN